MVALASLTLFGAALAADNVAPGALALTETARAADAQVAAAPTLIRNASRRSGISAEGAYNAYELTTNGPAGEVWIRNRLVDGQTGAGAAMASERNDGQLGGFPLNTERYVVWYERFTEMPNTTSDRWQVVGPEIHGPNVSAFPQALLMLEVGPDKRRRLNANAGRASTRYRDIGPIELNRTYAMKMRVRLSAGSDGIIQIWRDGVLVVNLTGATIDQAIAGSYWKEANYRNATINGPNTHEFSSLRIWDGDVAFGSGTAPAPTPTPTPTPTPAPPPSTTPVPALGQALPASTFQTNPTFAGGLAGWVAWQGSAALATASDGTSVATVSHSTGTAFALGETSPGVAAPVAGARYRSVAWVRASTPQSVGKQVRVYARQLGTQDVVGSPVTLTASWQQTAVDITASGAKGIDTRVGLANATTGDQIQVGMISTTPAAAAPAPPPATNLIAKEGFEGTLPGQSGSPFTLVTDSGNQFSAVGSPAKSGAKAGSFTQAGTGNRVMMKTTYTGRRDVTASVSVYVSKNTLAVNHNRSVMRVSAGPGSTAGPRHEVGFFREGNGAMHWAIWSVGKNGNYTYAKLGSAPKLGTWQTLKLETQWDRVGATSRLTIDGVEALVPAAVDLSGVKANNFEVGLNYSNPADPATVVLDDVSLTEGAFTASAAELKRGKRSKRLVGVRSRGLLDVRIPTHLVPGKSGAVSFPVPSRVKYTVTVLKGKTIVARYHKTAKPGVNRFGLRAPRVAGQYTVRLVFPSVRVLAPITVGATK